ncbi:MAG: D-alanyl-D-alanine carboxypeptidase [Cyanobacteria bacterium J06633_2]
MNRSPIHGDRHSLIPHTTYCRVRCEKNWATASMFNLHIQLFDSSGITFDQQWEEVSGDDLSTLLSNQLGDGWTLTTAQQFDNWWVHLYQKPASTNQHKPIHKNSKPPGTALRHKLNLVKPRLHLTWFQTRAEDFNTSTSHRPFVQPISFRARLAGVLGLGIGFLGFIAWGFTTDAADPIGQMASNAHESGFAITRASILDEADQLIRQQVTRKSGQSFVTPPDSFERAVAIAQQAVLDGRAAQSGQRWKQIARRWWSAAEFMAEVPPADPRYAIAQNRVNQYRQYSSDAVLEITKHAAILPIHVLSESSTSLTPTPSASNTWVSDSNADQAVEKGDPIGSCQDRIHAQIQQILNPSQYEGSQWGMHVESINTGQVLYGYNSDTFFIPASNIKLFTTASAFYSNRVNQSTDINTLIHNSNLNSNNWSAEILLNQMGGALEIKTKLHRLGIDPSGYYQVDGSGLSRQNQATPRALVQVLNLMYEAPNSANYIKTLPIAGKRGTLHYRFRHTPAHERVFAKTGTLQGVRSLSGYLNHPDLGTLSFSILANHPHQSGYTLLPAIDAIVLQLMQIEHCHPQH